VFTGDKLDPPIMDNDDITKFNRKGINNAIIIVATKEYDRSVILVCTIFRKTRTVLS
jgi:hypothetical protein